MIAAPAPDTRQVGTFLLDGAWFAIDLERVQEVLLHQAMTRVPLAPPSLAGLVNLRGDIVTAIDLRLRLGMPSRTPEMVPMNVVVRTPDGPVILLVDEVGDAVTVREDTFEPAPSTLEGPVRDLVLGVYKLADGLMLLLSPDEAVRMETNDRATREVPGDET